MRDEALFIRLVDAEAKVAGLHDSIDKFRNGVHDPRLFEVNTSSLKQVPKSALAYWLAERALSTFACYPPLESQGRRVERGLFTGDDFRFLRLMWEVCCSSPVWGPLSKGGEYAPWYYDIHLAVRRDPAFAEIHTAVVQKYSYLKGNSSWVIHPECSYGRAGLTYPLRTTSEFSARCLPAGCYWTNKGISIFEGDPSEPDSRQLLYMLGVLNSRVFRALLAARMGAADAAARGYEEGILATMPWPAATSEQVGVISDLALRAWLLKRSSDRVVETASPFEVPALLLTGGPDLRTRAMAWSTGLARDVAELKQVEYKVDTIALELFGLNSGDLGEDVEATTIKRRDTREANTRDARGLVSDLVSWAVGVALARFDVRIATGERVITGAPDPFAPLPAYAPGMLPEGKVPAGYPVQVAEDGILVEDEGHEWDIVERVREVFHLVFRKNAEAIEREACEILGVESLRDYFTLLGVRGFWDDHVKRYSKSRRRAPIYWLLQSPRGHYSAWVYYHRLNRDTLPKLLGPRYLGSKIQKVRHAIAELRPGGQTKPGITKPEERRLAELDELLVDLEEFGRRIRAVIDRVNDRGEVVGYDPDLDDGVVLNAAPLHELIPWPRKKKFRGRSVSELAAYWEELREGKYDWAHVAMRYWPTRVTEKCKQDRSLALAHGLDREFFPGLREELRRQAETAATADVPDDDLATDEDDDEEEA